MSAADPSDHRLDHWVALKFENRALDHRLGQLHRLEERPASEGARGKFGVVTDQVADQLFYRIRERWLSLVGQGRSR